MSTGKIILIGAALFGVGYLIFRTRSNTESLPIKAETKKIAQDVDRKHQGLEQIIQAYRQEALHYQIFNWRNRKKVSLAAEEALFSTYPKVLGEPVLKLPEELVLKPEVVSGWLASHGKTVGEHEYVGRVLADYLLTEANKEAEIIVNKYIEQASPHSS